MKTFSIFVTLFFWLSFFTLNAQAPDKFNYQAVAKNGSNAVTGSIEVEISIIDGSTVVYMEKHNTSADLNGLFNLQVGGGLPLSGSWNAINWGAGSGKFLKVRIKPAGGSYIDMGAQELVSVPYSLQSRSSAQLQGKAVSSMAPLNGQVLQWNNTAWTPTTLPTGSPGWLLTGNAGTNPSIHFIGTTDNQPLVFKVNSALAGKIAPAGGNTFLGLEAGLSNTAGIDNSALGHKAFRNNTSGSFNTAVGINALLTNTSGVANTGIGSNALCFNTTGQHNTALGNEALNANTTGINNTATGKSALHNNTTGNWNTAAGIDALHSNTSGLANTGVGSNALYSNTTGQYNTAIGDAAMNVNTTGVNNTAAGKDALHNNKTGNWNTAMGIGALYSNFDGPANTGIGSNALYSNTTGQDNTALGNGALSLNTTGNNITGVGSGAAVSTGNFTNATVIGSGATVNASNKVVIGNSSVTVIGGYVDWSILSDGRFKENVQEAVPGLSFITRLTPVTYTVNTQKLDDHVMQMMPDSIRARRMQSPEDYAKSTTIIHTGLIAQDVEKAAREIGYSFDGVNPPTNSTDTYSLSYGQFVVPLIKAIQEQQKLIETLALRVEALEQKVQELENK